MFNLITINIFLYFFNLIWIALNRSNLILVLISIEIILLTINLNFIFFSFYLDDLLGELFFLLILTVAAAESAIGLALIILFFRKKGIIDINKLNLITI